MKPRVRTYRDGFFNGLYIGILITGALLIALDRL